MVAFADDTGLIITGKDLEEIQRIFEDCYKEVQRWMKSVGLELADHKTETVLFKYVKYLGVMLDTRLNCKAHVEYAAAKAVRVANALASQT